MPLFPHARKAAYAVCPALTSRRLHDATVGIGSLLPRLFKDVFPVRDPPFYPGTPGSNSGCGPHRGASQVVISRKGSSVHPRAPRARLLAGRSFKNDRAFRATLCEWRSTLAVVSGVLAAAPRVSVFETACVRACVRVTLGLAHC